MSYNPIQGLITTASRQVEMDATYLCLSCVVAFLTSSTASPLRFSFSRITFSLRVEPWTNAISAFIVADTCLAVVLPLPAP